MWSSAGLAWLWQKVPIRSARRKDLLFASAVMTVSLWLAGRVLTSGSVLASLETGALPAAEQVASYLESALQPGDAVIVLFPSDAPIRYYMRRHGLSAAQFHERGQPAVFRRGLAVVNKTTGESLQEVVDKVGLSSSVDLSSARTVKTFDTAVIVELRAPKELSSR
jgi:hypothetical protein